MGYRYNAERVARNFWAKVDRSGPVMRLELGPCWVWTAAKQPKGYGKFWDGKRYVYAHRHAWELANGAPSACVLHRCDNPSCVRADHLFAGTIQDNNRDMREKGRVAHGERSGTSKLSVADVIDMRARFRAGEPTPSLAARFAIQSSTVASILLGDHWSHVPGALARDEYRALVKSWRASTPRKARPSGWTAYNAKLDWDKVREIRRLGAAGATDAELTARYNVSRVLIDKVMANVLWHDPEAKPINRIKKVDEDTVRAIRAEHAAGARQVDLAERYGIHQTAVSAITRRATWKHVA